MIGSSRLIVITHPKFNKKSPWKSYKGTPKGNRHCLPTVDGWNPAPPGINYLSTGAGFLPSTVSFFKGKLAAKLPRIYIILWNFAETKNHHLFSTKRPPSRAVTIVNCPIFPPSLPLFWVEDMYLLEANFPRCTIGRFILQLHPLTTRVR